MQASEAILLVGYRALVPLEQHLLDEHMTRTPLIKPHWWPPRKHLWIPMYTYWYDPCFRKVTNCEFICLWLLSFTRTSMFTMPEDSFILYFCGMLGEHSPAKEE